MFDSMCVCIELACVPCVYVCTCDQSTKVKIKINKYLNTYLYSYFNIISMDIVVEIVNIMHDTYYRLESGSSDDQSYCMNISLWETLLLV